MAKIEEKRRIRAHRSNDGTGFCRRGPENVLNAPGLDLNTGWDLYL
jgi:hypothetical protein